MRQPYLLSRNGYFYFRYTIPLAAQASFGYKEFVYSLNTKNYHQAKAKVGILLVMSETVIQKVKQNRLTPEQARELARRYFKQALERLQKQFDEADSYSIAIAQGEAEPPVGAIRDRRGFIVDPDFPLTKQAQYLFPPDLSITVDADALHMLNRSMIYNRLLKEYGLQDILPGTLSYQTFTHAIDRAITELQNIQQQKLSHEADIQTKDDWFKDRQEPQKLSPLQQSGMTLKEAITDFVAERMRGKEWTERTKKDREARFTLLCEILGDDFDITLLDARKARDVKTTLQALPKNRNKNPKTRDLSLQDALTVTDAEKLDTRTVNEYLTVYQSFFGWAEEQGHIPKSPFKKLAIRQKKNKQKKRDAFSREQINVILAALTEHTPEKSGKSYRYWGTAIAIYTGARLNEIAQLSLDDIKQEDDVWYFDITDEGEEGEEKRLKTENAKRRVPVHNSLLSLGIIERVEKLKAQKQPRLFPDLEYQRNFGYGRNLGRWINETLLVDLGIKTRKLSFHSFRHSAITHLRQSGIDSPTVKELVGHDKGDDVTEQVYNNYSLQQLKAAIDRLVY